MNILFMSATQMLVMTEGAGGLFDFNATLPLMAIQFILLTVVLTFVFYKPVSKVIDDRETYINDNLTTASEKLINKLDQNPYLLCFNNFVVDFKEKIWRTGQPDDYISKCTNIDFIPYNEIKDSETVTRQVPRFVLFFVKF